jgi:hypothetical protein
MIFGKTSCRLGFFSACAKRFVWPPQSRGLAKMCVFLTCSNSVCSSFCRLTEAKPFQQEINFSFGTPELARMIGFSISGTRRCAWSLDRDFCARAHINGRKLSCAARCWIRFVDHNIGASCGSIRCVPAFSPQLSLERVDRG